MQKTLLGVVAKAVNYKDHDRILTLITREHGVVTASVHGCRKPQSRLMPCSQVFCYGEYVFTERNGKLYVTSCDIREIFYDLRLSPETLSAGAFLTAACTEFANPQEPFTKQFTLLLCCLKALCEHPDQVRAIVNFFIVKLMAFEGYQPQTDNCVLCGETAHITMFHAESGGAVCPACARNLSGVRTVGQDALMWMGRMAQTPSAAYDAIAPFIQSCAPVQYPALLQYMQERIGRKLPQILL